MRTRIITLALACAVAGCKAAPLPQAALPPEAFQVVRVDTPGVSGAACTVQTPKGSHVLLSPASVSVARTASPIRVSCTKGEHFSGTHVITPRSLPEGEHVAYTYPALVSVPMGMNARSLDTNVRVF